MSPKESRDSFVSLNISPYLRNPQMAIPGELRWFETSTMPKRAIAEYEDICSDNPKVGGAKLMRLSSEADARLAKELAYGGFKPCTAAPN
jgi:hypothetical protein